MSRHAAGTAPLTLRRGKKGRNMEKETAKAMPADLLRKWEEVHGCYKLLAAGRAKIEHKIVKGEMVYYTKPTAKKATWGEQMMKKQQITIGDYKVQQASNCHVFIVHIPDSRMVFHSQTNHWLTEEELRAAFDFYKQAAGWETEECSE